MRLSSPKTLWVLITLTILSTAGLVLQSSLYETTASAKSAKGVLFWVRKDGDHSIEDHKMPKVAPKHITPPQKTHKIITRRDLQYQKKITFRGVPLQQLIKRYNPPKDTDLALLHFRNKMIIPYIWRDTKIQKQLDPFVAYSWKGEHGWTQKFPPIRRKDLAYTRRKPIRPTTSKLVVASLQQPGLDRSALKHFSPWLHVDSLVGVEFVQSQAYYKQFTVSNKVRALKGLNLYQRYCQYCHGARDIGAKRGWDFVRPIPAYKHRRSARQLFYHIKYRISANGERMPALPHMTLKQATDLWNWLHALAKYKMPPYKRK